MSVAYRDRMIAALEASLGVPVRTLTASRSASARRGRPMTVFTLGHLPDGQRACYLGPGSPGSIIVSVRGRAGNSRREVPRDWFVRDWRSWDRERPELSRSVRPGTVRPASSI